MHESIRRTLRLASLGACFCFGLASCGGGGANSAAPARLPGASGGGSSASSSSITFPLSPAGTTQKLPAAGGIGGAVTFPKADVPSGATMTVSSSTTASASGFSEKSLHRLATGSLSVLYYLVFTPSVTVQFPTVPGFSIALPSGVSTAGRQFYYAISDPTVTDVALQFRTEGPASVSGQTVTFDASAKPLTLQAGRSYVFAFYATTTGATLQSRINHVIVVYQENWSFDGLYGKFPGANGIANAGSVQQVDKAGAPLASAPQPLNANNNPDPRFPSSTPVTPYNLLDYIGTADATTGDIIHRYYHEQLQIDAGKMDKFVTWSDNGGLVMSYIDATALPEGQLAAQYTLADNFFHSAFGGSFLNHFWLVCACTPTWPNAPAAYVSNPDPTALKDAQVTPDGFAINTAFTVNSPHPATITDSTGLVPEQTQAHIGDRLDAANISWAWYSGGWNDAIAGHAAPLFQFHHQPFAYFENLRDGTPARAAHLKDEQDFFGALQTGTLPSVSFVKPLGPDNEHPGYAALERGQQHVADIVNAVKNSPFWNDTAIIVTYDENGGRWDHVAPPAGDRWGPGSRVPALVISPYAKRHYVDHTQYETVSVLKLIETRWKLAPLGTRDAKANDLVNAFDFTQTPN